MPKTLESENLQLRYDLAQLLKQARHNEKIIRRHQQLDLKFIGAASFLDLVDSIFQTLPLSSDLDVVTLSLIDPDYDIRRILVDLNIPLSEFPHLLFLQEEAELGELLHQLHSPVLGPYAEELHGAMFPEPVIIPHSVAIVPLVRNHKLIGTLNLGSFQAERFTPSMATDLIEHLASIVTICIENVINNERLKYIGLTDPLTGVNNRRYIERRLQEEIGRAYRQGGPFSCIYIDIDHFKKINDSAGHQGGDEILREVALRIKAELRLSDALGRHGGEEFLVLLIDAEMGDAAAVAERIRASIAEEPFSLSTGGSLAVTVSLGVATMVTPDRSAAIATIAQQLVAQADAALYKAKEGGRNRVVSAE